MNIDSNIGKREMLHACVLMRKTIVGEKYPEKVYVRIRDNMMEIPDDLAHMFKRDDIFLARYHIRDELRRVTWMPARKTI